MKKIYYKIKKWWNSLGKDCPNCGGSLEYTADDYIGHTWIAVYTCTECKTQYV